MPSLNQHCRGKRFSSNQQNVPIINHTSYGSLTYLNENLHAVTSTLVKPNYAYRRFRVATLQYIKATILSAPISKTNVLNSHSDIFKKTAVLNSWHKYLKHIRGALFSSCILLLYSNKLLRIRKFLSHSQKFGTAKYLNTWYSKKLCLAKYFHYKVTKNCLFLVNFLFLYPLKESRNDLIFKCRFSKVT